VGFERPARFRDAQGRPYARELLRSARSLRPRERIDRAEQEFMALIGLRLRARGG